MVLKIQSWLSNLGAFLTTLIRLTLLSKFNLKHTKGGHSQCVLLGNGPSFTPMLNNHESFLRGKDLICVNHFPTTDFYTTLKPGTYMTSAPDLWLDDIDQRFVDQSKHLFSTMAERTDWPMDFYIPYEAKKHLRWQEPLLQNPHINIVYYNNTPVEGWRSFRHFCFNRGWGMPRPHNVMIPSLMLAVRRKYQQVFLWGADHSWLSEISVNDQNQVLINQKHFYDQDQSQGRPLDKRGKGSRNLPELLTKFVLAFRGYFVIKEYAQERSVQIINNTPGSFIDAFDRQILNISN